METNPSNTRSSARIISTKVVLFAALCLLIVSTIGCAKGNQLRARAEHIDSTSRRIHDAAYNCAERELATAQANLDFGKYELRRGNFMVAEDHLAVSLQNINAAAAIVDARPECWPGYVPDSDGDGILDDVDVCPLIPGLPEWDGCPNPDTDGDGVCNAWVAQEGFSAAWAHVCVGSDLCPDVPGLVEWDGCPNPDTDGDGLCDPWVAEARMSAQWAHVCTGTDACPLEPGPPEHDGCPPPPPPPEFVVVTDTMIEITQQIHFATNEARILPESFRILDEVAGVLRSRTEMHIRIEGHTDSRGSARHNLRLSDDRAASVRAYLIQAGIDPGRMISVGYGMERPIADNRSAEGRARNRRVEFHIIGQ